MYRPKKIKTVLKTNLGIFVLKPVSDTIEVTNIGPKNQAKGTLKYSAIRALGTTVGANNYNASGATVGAFTF